MRRILLMTIVMIFAFGSHLDARKLKPKELPQHYRKWLMEEVVYIITPTEKDVFLQLESDREREVFIKAFWQQRDPNPNTPDNEFKIEHYERIRYANRWFGRENPAPGWRSDQGRIYIILGEPNQKDKFYNLTGAKPTEIWFYNGRPEMGLPNSFNVVFFKQSAVEEFRLYSPIKFGPASLLDNFSGDVTDYQQAYNMLYDIEPTIAATSITLFPNESNMVSSPSLSSEVLISTKIPKAPTVKVNSRYAEKILKYKGIVSVNQLVNYVERDSMVRVLRDSSGVSFLHYLIEPKRLSLERYDEYLYTNLEISGRITDLAGKTVFQFNRKIPVKLPFHKLRSISSKLFSFQDMIPLVSGSYKYSILLMSTAQEEFTTIEGDILVPAERGTRMSPLILANRMVENSSYRGQFKPFMVNNIQLVPSPRNDFNSKDTLFIGYQLHGISKKTAAAGHVEYKITSDKDQKTVWSLRKNISDYKGNENIVEFLPLKDLYTSYYSVEVSVHDETGKKILQEQGTFFIAPFTLKRPWVMSMPFSREAGSRNFNILGNQYLNLGKISSARNMLARAHAGAPLIARYARDYAALLIKTRQFSQAKSVIQPFLNGENKKQFILLKSQVAYGLGEFKNALDSGEEYLKHFGVNVSVLNMMADCLVRLGDNKQAIKLLERSLKEEPEQKGISDRIRKLKEGVK